MVGKRHNSTTAILVSLSFLQPLPGLARAKAETSESIPAGALATTIECLKNFKGKLKDAEQSCLEELKHANLACDPRLYQSDGRPARNENGASAEKIAERIVRAVNVEVCAADAVKAGPDTKAAKKADNAGDAKAQANALAAANASAADDLKAEKTAAAEADAKARAKASALAAAKAEADAEEEAKANSSSKGANAAAGYLRAEARSKRRVAAEAQAQADADAKAQLEAEARSKVRAKALTEAEAKRAEKAAASEAAARAAAQSAECVVKLVDAKGATLCADDMTQAEIAAVTAAATAKTDVKVSNRTITQDATRSSKQEFPDPKVSASNGGLTNLEKAGLLVLGAVVVGTILKNGEKVTARTDDRVVVQDQYGNYSVLKDDDVLVREVGSTVRTETFSDGSTRTFVTRKDGVQIVTIRDSFGHVQRRTRIDTDGRAVVLIDDTRTFAPVEVSTLPRRSAAELSYRDTTDRADLRKALAAAEARDLGRSFSLSQVRQYREVRDLAPEINLDNITFRTNSSAVEPSEAAQLREIGLLLVDYIAEDPREMFLIEGYTDAIGNESYNLLLSDRRAESVALALSEYFGVRRENMVVQGYGESFPLVPTLEAERRNRRVAVRRITDLIQAR